MAELDESDIRACGGYLPLGCAGLDGGTLGETENESGLDSGTRVEEGSDVDADLGRVLPETGETANGESVTNEANYHEEVKSSNYITSIGLTTNSGVDSGLDKGEIDHDFDGGGTDGGGTDCGEAFRESRPPTAACGGTSPTRGEREHDGGQRLGAGVTTRSVGEAALTQSVGARGIEKSGSERGETFRARQPLTAACGGTSPKMKEGDFAVKHRQWHR